MDKRRLFEDIALIKRRMFALSAFAGFSAVAVATIFGRGFDFFALFVNSVIALMVFGGLGFALGVIYERLVQDPLIESYREEERGRIRALQQQGEPETLEMEIPVSELKAGMAVCQQVNSSSGALLVRSGAVLTDRLIKTLKDQGIDRVVVKAQRSAQQESDYVPL